MTHGVGHVIDEYLSARPARLSNDGASLGHKATPKRPPTNKPYEACSATTFLARRHLN